MTAEEEQALLDALSIEIRAKAKAAFDELLARIRAGDSPQDALKAISASYQFAVEVALAHAFTQVMGEFVGVADIKALSIGGISLSDTLYRHLGETNKVALTIINDHLKGVLEAKKLALELYSGYGYGQRLPIKARLPKYLRAAMRDPALSHGFSQIFARAQASKLKTEAMKAGYLALIDAVAAGAGQERLKKLLTHAWYERNRYLASRIAQTETHRAYSQQVAKELMQDDGLLWVQVVMSQTHPKYDVCDRHSKLNAYGKGPGVYPKALAPRPVFHPFCRCVLRPRYDLQEETYREDPHAERRFMSTLTDDQQRQVAGGWAKLERFRGGESLTAIHDDGVRPEYRLQMVGDSQVWPGKSKLERIKAFLDGDGHNPIHVADAPKDIIDALGAENGNVLLSRFTAEKQQKHPEIKPYHYVGLLQRVIETGNRVYDRDRHATVIYTTGRQYVAVIKATADGKWLFLQSFRRSDSKNIESLKKRGG